jgi:deoxycytidylate deaminase
MPIKKAPLVIGLTGPIGSGVTTVSRILEARDFHRVSLSTAIKAELLAREHEPAETPIHTIPDWRQKLQDIGDEGRQQSPTHWLDKALLGLPDEKNVVIDGIRNTGEVDGLRNLFPNFYLAAVVAQKAVRWERVKKLYANDLTRFERDDGRDSDDKDDRPQGQQVGRCVNEADYVFINDDNNLGSQEVRNKKLADQLWTDVEIMLGLKPRDPHEHESYMAQAYALSHRSLCLKRYVGAVIVDHRGIPLSSGFNENPVEMQPCVRQFGFCYKDDLMHKELEELPFLYCPECGHKNEKLKRPWLCANPSCRTDLKKKLYPSRNIEKCTAIHAEERALLGLLGRTATGATMYVTTFPCFQCARQIVEAGIKRVVYIEAYPIKEAADFLALNGVEVKPFSGFKARAFSRVFKPVS